MISSLSLAAINNQIKEVNEDSFTSFKISRCAKELYRLTHPFNDFQGHTVQLFKFKNKLVGGVLDSQGRLTVVPSAKIVNPLNHFETEIDLIHRLERTSNIRWDLALDTAKMAITIWPHLVAAGNRTNDPRFYVKWPVADMAKDIQKRIENLKKGALNPRHFKWYAREIHGKVSKNNHINEVDSYLTGANTLRDQIAHKLKTGGLTPEETRQVEKALSDASKFLRNSKIYVASFKKFYDPAFKDFAQRVRANGLESSYNASHPKRPILGGPGGGSIGGVANDVGIIEGMFETAGALEEEGHYFYLPSGDGKMPFSPKELQQILRELAVGIYVHDTVPFFSLHFNEDTHMYPVIHPVYEHTLVGKVISLLDYYMKGFLNGGFFDEAFLKEWQKNKSQDDQFLKKKCIDIHNYCKQNLGSDAKYFSVREFIEMDKNGLFAIEKQAQKGEELLSEPAIFSDYSGFRSSFRIIAKQNSIKKTGALFELDAGFDVLYTIEPDPAYEEALQKYRLEYGHEPLGYQRLVHAYERAKHQISTLMPKLPLFKELFDQLKVINFFCYYLKTLKKAQKIPLFSKIERDHTAGSVPLFPHLPLRRMKSEKVEVNFGEVFKSIAIHTRQKLEKYLFGEGRVEEEPPQDVVEAALRCFREHLQSSIKSFSISKEKEFIDEHRTFIVQFLKDQRKSIHEIKNRPSRIDLGELKRRQEQVERNISIVNSNIRSCTAAIKLMNRGAVYQRSRWEIQSDLTECEQKLPKFKEDLALLQRVIKKVEECDEMVSQFKLIKVLLTETKSEIEFFSEQPAEEREENKRVVGGCGLALKNMPLTQAAMEVSLVSHTISTLEVNQDEELVPITMLGESKARGHAFKLHLTDFASVRGKDYHWMTFLQTEEEESGVAEKREFINTILFEDEELFLELVGRFKNRDVDLQGIHAIHHAAAAQSPLFLNKLLEAGHSMQTEDLQGYLPIHYAAKAGRLDQIRSLKFIDHPSKSGITPLHMAVQCEQFEAVDLLLRLGANPNAKTTYGMTPLYSAVHNRYEKIALRLIQHQATLVDLAVEDKSTPLFIAVENNMPLVVDQLLKRGADFRLQRRDTYNPLHIAAKQGFLEICARLLSAGIDVNAKLKSGKTALHIAAAGHPEIVRLLLAYGADPRQTGWDGRTALMSAIVAGDTLSSEYIINFSVELPLFKEVLVREDLKKETPIIACLQRRQYSVLDLLLKHNISITYSPEVFILLCKAKIEPEFISDIISQAKVSQKELFKIILLAQKHGHNALVSYLLLFLDIKASALPIDSQGLSLVHYAAEHDHIDVIKEFLKTSQDLIQLTSDGRSIAAIAAENCALRSLGLLIDAIIEKNVSLQNHYKGQHLLAAAVEAGHEKAADVIIHKILNPNIPLDSQKTNAAHLAAKKGDVEMLSFLRSRGARFDAIDSQNKTPFHYAVDGNWKEALDYFLDQKNEISLPDNLLRYASGNGSAEMIDRLLKREYKVNEANTDTGKTAVYRAISEGNLPAFEKLCQHGADLMHRSNDGLTPLLLAAKLGQVQFISQILDKLTAEQRASSGQTALHLAVLGGHEESVRLLLRAGYRPDSEKLDGQTALELAKSLQFLHIQLLLEGKEELIQNRKGLIVQALEKGQMPPQEFLNMIQGLPVNQPMLFHVNSKMKNVPLLHLIHEVASDDRFRERLLEPFYKLPGMDPAVKCSKGRTLSHLLAQLNRDFGKSPIDLFAQDGDGVTPLHFYAKEAALEKLKHCITPGKSVDVESKQGITPLLAAITFENLNNVRVLLENGANPNHVNAMLVTPLALAVQTNQIEIVRLLLKHGAKINQRVLNDKSSPLLLAIDQGKTNMAQALIIEGANVNLADLDGKTPIHVAALRGNLPLIRLLLSAGAHTWAVDNEGRTIAHYAAQSDNTEIIDYFLAHGVSFSTASKVRVESLRVKNHFTEGTTPLHLASIKGNRAMMQKLVDRGCNVESKTERGKSPLAYAARSPRKEALRFYRDYRIIENSEQRIEAIQMALVIDGVSQLKEFYREGFAINDFLDVRGKTALHYAALFGALNCTIFLKQLGADLHKKDLDQKTPLDLAVAGKHLPLVRYLVHEMESIDLDASEIDQKPYLHQACDSGAVELAAMLIQLGASVEKVDFQGMRPIHIAAKQANYTLLWLLLAFGADMLAKTQDGHTLQSLLNSADMLALVEKYRGAQIQRLSAKETLIHTAATLNDEKHLRLLSKGVDINAKDAQGQTALHKASLAGNLSMLCQLVSLGATVDEKDALGFTPLQLAVQNQRQLAFVRFFLQAGADVTVKDREGNSLLYLISQLPHLEYARSLFNLVVEYLPKTSKDAPSQEMLDAFAEAKKGKIAPFFHLINAGHPVVNEKFSLLHLAVGDLNLLVVKSLLDWFEPNSIKIDHQDAEGQTALHLAAKRSVEISSYLLDHKASPLLLCNQIPLLQVVSDESTPFKISPEERMAIFDMIYKRLPRLQQNFISLEMDQAISAANINGFFKAVNEGHPVDSLLFFKAVSRNSLAIVKFLAEWFHCDLECSDQYGCSPLHVAAKNGDADVALYLLSVGASINVKNKRGKTLLHSMTDNKTPKQRELFRTIYARIPKIAERLSGVQQSNISDESCFQYLQSGYSINEVSLLAAKANCVFTIRTLHTLLPEQVDLKALAKSARSAKADLVIEYIQSQSPTLCCAIL